MQDAGLLLRRCTQERTRVEQNKEKETGVSVRVRREPAWYSSAWASRRTRGGTVSCRRAEGPCVGNIHEFSQQTAAAPPGGQAPERQRRMASPAVQQQGIQAGKRHEIM